MEGRDMAKTLTYERNVQIFLDRCSGKSLKDIGEKHGISCEQVRQIICRFAKKAIDYEGVKAKNNEFACLLFAAIREGFLKDRSEKILKDTDIHCLDLSARSANVLKNYGATTLHDVWGMTFDDLMKLQNMGKKSAYEIIESIKKISTV
jgi:DNA-directed RNA polymerase alpha subunit